MQERDFEEFKAIVSYQRRKLGTALKTEAATMGLSHHFVTLSIEESIAKVKDALRTWRSSTESLKSETDAINDLRQRLELLRTCEVNLPEKHLESVRLTCAGAAEDIHHLKLRRSLFHQTFTERIGALQDSFRESVRAEAGLRMVFTEQMISRFEDLLRK